MTPKEELLKQLTVKQLKQLANENNIELVNLYVFGKPPLTKKDDIIRLLRNSPTITSRKINKIERAQVKKISSSSKLERRMLSQAEKDRVLLRQDYQCAKCGLDLSKIVQFFDHKRTLAQGGSNTLRNIQALCANCHAEKTREDRYKIAKARSIS